MFVSTGTQVQLPGMQATYHEGDDMQDFIKTTSSRVHEAFDGETQHKVIKVVHRRTGLYKLMTFSPSLDLIVLNALENWLQDKIKTEYSPVTFDFHFFLSSDEPKVMV